MEKLEIWRKHVTAQRASGLSQTKYCAREGLSPSSFGYWAQRLRGGGSAKAEGGEFIALTSGAGLEIEIGAAVIRVKPGSDVKELRRVVEALIC